MNLQVHNNLTGRKEPFVPQDAGRVKMYVCGVTPYDECHLGHARCYTLFDTIRRFFQTALDWRVTYVQNFTDIDDKIIARAQKLGMTHTDVSEKYIADYFTQMRRLGILDADAYPRVTQVLPDIVQFIQKLVERKHAYAVDGDVFYSVRSFKEYGKLSKRTLDDMESGARVAVDERKTDPLDFALWKKAKPGEPAWDSPWGPGRPGWHIECSVMSILHLGETFDLHGGGHDLIFPHHENEIAQSEGATGKPFARCWVHNGFVTVNREKMSKSLGNFFTLNDIFKQYAPEVVRFFLLSRHYRSPLDFSDDLLSQARSAYQNLQDTDAMASFVLEEEEVAGNLLEEYKKDFTEAMCDDFNTEKAIAVAFGLRQAMAEKVKSRDRAWLADARRTLHWFLEDLLGVTLKTGLTTLKIKELKIQLHNREEARKKKDWKAADVLRKAVEDAGYLIEDTPSGAVVKPKH